MTSSKSFLAQNAQQNMYTCTHRVRGSISLR